MKKRNGLLVFVLIAVVTIAACGGGGGGGSSPSATGQPTNVVATAGNGQVTVSWTTPSGSGTISSYTVYYSTTNPVTTSSPTKMTGITANSATITGLTNGSTYYFIVTAIINGVESTPSSQVSAIPMALGTLITSPTASPIVSFTQSVVSNDTGTYNEIFPGQANLWSLDPDFSLVDGYDDQFNYAIALTVGAEPFPADQDYSELTYYTPVMGTADGVKVAAVSDGTTVMSALPAGVLSGVTSVKAGSYAAFLNATSDSRLQQTVDLTSVPTGATLYFSWNDAVSLDPGSIPDYTPYYRIVIRDTGGTLLKVIPRQEPNPSYMPNSQSATNILTPYAGQKIVISFEESSSNSPFGIDLTGLGTVSSPAYAIIDSVSIKDMSAHEYVVNGGFETGDLTGWTTNTPAEIQNVTSGSRTLEGLNVTRSFYTVPNKLWGRWVDTFTNPTSATIVKTVTYETSPGSDGFGIIYATPGTNNKALTSWDFSTGDRDIGLVFGNDATRSVTFKSYDGVTPVTSPDDVITIKYVVTVPAGGSVVIVNFVIMDGTDTGETALGDITKKATDIDAAAADIVNNFWTDDQYRAGMTQLQIESIKNFAN